MILDTGFIVVLGTLVIVFIVGLIVTHPRSNDEKYDERQEIAIGKAAIPALSVCVIGDLFGGLLLPYLPVDGGFLMAVVGLAGITVYALLAIRENAYFGISEHWKKRTVFFIVLGVLYLLSGVQALKGHTGKLSFSDIYLPMSMVFFVIGFYSVYRHLKMESESEEK